MAFESTELADGLLGSLTEAEADKRNSYLQDWLDTAIVQLQQAVASEMKKQVQGLIGVATTPEGWKPLPKWSNQSFSLVLEVRFRRIGDRPIAKATQSAREATAVGNFEDDYPSDRSSSDRSPNDDRSDSMNPNNDAYHAAMDNHANQSNPNNDAYWSSRGR